MYSARTLEINSKKRKIVEVDCREEKNDSVKFPVMGKSSRVMSGVSGLQNMYDSQPRNLRMHTDFKVFETVDSWKKKCLGVPETTWHLASKVQYHCLLCDTTSIIDPLTTACPVDDCGGWCGYYLK